MLKCTKTRATSDIIHCYWSYEVKGMVEPCTMLCVVL